MNASTTGRPDAPDLSMPSHAFLIAAFLPALAAVARTALHGSMGGVGLLIWILGLAPVFLLTRYMGWKGALLGLAWTSAMVVIAELFTALLEGGAPAWPLVGTVIAVTGAAALGAGLERQFWVSRQTEPVRSEGPAQIVSDLPTGAILYYFLDKLFEAARRKPPLSIVMLEVDRYDEYVSMYGEAKASRALEVAVQALKAQTRASNMYGRIDDRRLVVFLSGETLAGAYGFAVRVLEEIASFSPPWSGRVTLSAGIAGFETSMPNADALLARSRQALDTARRMGGERIVVASGTTGETLVTPGMTVVNPDGKVREIRSSV
ncbi:MAG: diguanylate cyclase [Candidatus Palauibacterales bacterium]|jgi:diguanylate cyclase (GGDEF)-like protein|nr:diguanylate cyclase [Candidatus Palauibacterales bacterium]MDP2483629.1 diguanylate cyclase [Candidatus Palauibacterales bacterium]